MGCAVACTVVIPQYPGGGCDVVTRPSGIKKLVFSACDHVFVDITNLTEWGTAITANKIHASGEIRGSKPKGSLTKKKLLSCRPEQVTGGSHTITFVDPNADNEAFGEYDFWNFIQLNQNRLLFGYTTCDDLLYGFQPTTAPAGALTEFSIEVDDTRTESSEEEASIEGTVTWLSKQMLTPVLVPGLNAALA